MSYRSLLAIAACIGIMFVGSEAVARGVTTDSCLARGLCAYVDTKGHVTCGKCPGQVRAHVIRMRRHHARGGLDRGASPSDNVADQLNAQQLGRAGGGMGGAPGGMGGAPGAAYGGPRTAPYGQPNQIYGIPGAGQPSPSPPPQ
jgi:hypothetical protein